MPVQIGRLWPILRVTGQKDPSALEIHEPLSRHSLFDEFLSIHADAVIIVKGPKTTVKLPMGILRERYPIAGVIITGVPELMNMGGIYNTLHL
jgi:hypothetical protein